jgi:hypothetical protein
VGASTSHNPVDLLQERLYLSHLAVLLYHFTYKPACYMCTRRALLATSPTHLLGGSVWYSYVGGLIYMLNGGVPEDILLSYFGFSFVYSLVNMFNNNNNNNNNNKCIDGVRIGWWDLLYRQLQRSRWSTHFTHTLGLAVFTSRILAADL